MDTNIVVDNNRNIAVELNISGRGTDTAIAFYV